MFRWNEWADGAHLAELVAFAAVLEEGSFTRAARRLSRDATVVSRRVSALEERLGVRLIERSTRRVAATEAGKTFLRQALAILDQLAAAESEATAHADHQPHGTLKIALPGTFGRMWVAPALPAFLDAHPRLKVELSFENRFVDLIGEGFDVAVRLGNLSDSGLVVRKVGERRRLLVAAPSYLARRGTPSVPADLKKHACLMFTFAAHPVWNLVSTGGERVSVRAAGPLVSDDAEALVAAAVGGMGIMLTTDWLVARELADGRLVPVLSDWTLDEGGALYLVVPSNRFVPAKTRAFMEFIAGLFLPVPPWQLAAPTPARRARVPRARRR
jgi:DNA-binding transcriptional LysR family regulator